MSQALADPRCGSNMSDQAGVLREDGADTVEISRPEHVTWL